MTRRFNGESNMNVFRKMVTAMLAAVVALVLGAGVVNAQPQVSKPFSGAKVNGGTVTHTVQDGKHVLTLSGDFQVPDTPDPHWQVVDSKGRVFLLQRLKVKGALAGVAGDKITTSITLPAYITDIAKVQIYCAWAEAVLGETTFNATLMTGGTK
jgi:hypothetical protein